MPDTIAESDARWCNRYVALEGRRRWELFRVGFEESAERSSTRPESLPGNTWSMTFQFYLRVRPHTRLRRNGPLPSSGMWTTA